MKHQPTPELRDYLADSFLELGHAHAQLSEARVRAEVAIEAGDRAGAQRQLVIVTDAIRNEIACTRVIGAALVHWPLASPDEALAFSIDGTRP